MKDTASTNHIEVPVGKLQILGVHDSKRYGRCRRALLRDRFRLLDGHLRDVDTDHLRPMFAQLKGAASWPTPILEHAFALTLIQQCVCVSMPAAAGNRVEFIDRRPRALAKRSIMKLFLPL